MALKNTCEHSLKKLWKPLVKFKTLNRHLPIEVSRWYGIIAVADLEPFFTQNLYLHLT
jgi:hypothetical protein